MHEKPTHTLKEKVDGVKGERGATGQQLLPFSQAALKPSKTERVPARVQWCLFMYLDVACRCSGSPARRRPLAVGWGGLDPSAHGAVCPASPLCSAHVCSPLLAPTLPAQHQAEVQRESDEAMASERRATSDMEHEALLRLEAVERANSAQTAEEEAREARASAEMLAESLRIQVCTRVAALSEHHERRPGSGI